MTRPEYDTVDEMIRARLGADTPAVLFEAGYISNADDEILLRSPEHRSAIVLALAQAIEADVAARSRR
jgi:N-acetylmuramoyl-L-alanine amidase